MAPMASPATRRKVSSSTFQPSKSTSGTAAIYPNAPGVRVGDIATRSPITVSPDMRLSEARALMEEHRIRRLPVMKGRELVGVLSLGDVAWADASTREVGEALKAVSESESTTTQ